MIIKQEIIDLISQRDIQNAEDYIRKMSKTELFSELMDKGYNKDDIEQQLFVLCSDGSFAADEENVYQYEML